MGTYDWLIFDAIMTGTTLLNGYVRGEDIQREALRKSIIRINPEEGGNHGDE